MFWALKALNVAAKDPCGGGGKEIRVLYYFITYITYNIYNILLTLYYFIQLSFKSREAPKDRKKSHPFGKN